MPKSRVAQKRKQKDYQAPSKKVKSEPSTSQNDAVEKVVKFKGVVPVDEGFPQYANGPYHVYSENGVVYNAMLNQTNIGQNNNKYYILQIVKHNSKNQFINLCRWGRVGKVAGSSEIENEFQKAKHEFCKKFEAKTGNRWTFVQCGSSFFKVKGKYDLVHVDYGKETVKEEVKKSVDYVPSNLHDRVQELIRLIFNKDEWEASVKEMKFDVKKAPLGKLTKEQIKAGYESLKKVEDCLKPKIKEKALEEACSEFYTRIPHDFGMKKPPLIRTTEEIKEKMDLLDALNDIEIGVTIMNESKKKQEVNTLDVYYDSLQCNISVLEKKSEEYKVIEKFVKNTHGSLHRYFKLMIEDIFLVQKEDNDKRFKKSIGNRMLLWHGSRLTNWCGILKQGLRIAPPEAPCTGYMFGKGVYFADVVSKSAQYCCCSARQPSGLLLVCEVALGSMNEKTNSDYNASNLPKGKHSTKGLGRQQPEMKKKHTLRDGAVVPLGKLKDTNVVSTWLRYNEYIVYDVAQIRPRYLVRVKFGYD